MLYPLSYGGRVEYITVIERCWTDTGRSVCVGLRTRQSQPPRSVGVETGPRGLEASRNGVQRDTCAGNERKGQVGVGIVLPPHHKSAEAPEPCESSFYEPALAVVPETECWAGSRTAMAVAALCAFKINL